MKQYDLSKWKNIAHKTIDQLWKNGTYSRKDIYKSLARILDKKYVHIAELNIEECKIIINKFKVK